MNILSSHPELEKNANVLCEWHPLTYEILLFDRFDETKRTYPSIYFRGILVYPSNQHIVVNFDVFMSKRETK